MAYWTNLLAEIRMMILGIVVEDYRFESDRYARAGYACVCQEWQSVFEQSNFRRIIVDQERIGDFEKIMGNEATRYRQGYLEHLVLCIKLDEYDCTACQSKEDDETIRNNNNVFFNSPWDLLFILSKWVGFVGTRREKGLTLELGVYSPSDCKHTFRDFHLEENHPYQEFNDMKSYVDAYKQRIDRLDLGTLNDPYHGWVNGHQESPSLGSKQRFMGTLTVNDNLPQLSIYSYTFPNVEIVTGLLIRRQFYWKIKAKFLDKLLRETFTCLRWFNHEQFHFEKDYERLLLHGIPSTLRELDIFENFNKVLHPAQFKQLTNLEQYTKRANPSLGKALSKSSRLLTMLSAAFIVDAVDFFASFKPTNNPNSNVFPGENLQYLALTSQLLHPRKADRHINGVLIAAGRAAAFMPKLRGMEIWNGGGGHACVFRYRNYDGKTYISWECTWGPKFKLDPDVIDCWANVPRQGQYPHGNFTVTVNKKLLRHRDTKTYGSIVPLLKQRSWMQHFISDFQMLSRKIRTQHLRHRHNIE